ncbi:MAG: hypothetical protein ABEJ67_07145 [Halanaeroarchaeum sp.]
MDYPAPRRPALPEPVPQATLDERARGLLAIPNHGRRGSGANPNIGFVGYDGLGEGDRVLLVATDHYDDGVVEAVRGALAEAGASVDLYHRAAPPDRPLRETDEVDVIIRREPFGEYDQPANDPRRYDYGPEQWLLAHAERAGYDAVLQGFAGPMPATPFRLEAVPWQTADGFASEATTYPPALHRHIDEVAWRPIWEHPGATVRLTDPEGTDLTFTLAEEYYERDHPVFDETPVHGHLMGHSPPPVLPVEDASGVVAGTTSHFNRPFPRIELTVEAGRVVNVEGGGEYGDQWRDLLAETRDVQYPGFPRPGLFHLWEVAIGTNPWVHRPADALRLSGGGMEPERNRSGVIHLGFGTAWGSPAERWAGERGHPYGHLHVHLLFPTYEVHADDGVHTVVDRGRLTALDDPAIRDHAAEVGDADDLLTERWIPAIPGVNAPGDYEEYAADPATFVAERLV